ncbi:hypothetical protein FGO68_gene17213 [Halteria grandinella]|uniref:Protein kinase domain-containing protein n=1 Tax=Halteria grandinella TaxID=5974 RepID=A0A8J8NMB6_HALGN|nr:hypothetical protein FGO68_gene17213 [Halteria grandinella]
MINRLHEYGLGFSEDLAKNLFSQLLEALKYLHQNNVVHLDIKHDNIYFDNNCNAIIGNFANARTVPSNENISLTMETSYYQPPESITFKGPYNAYKIDIYALGVVFHSAITQQYPSAQRQELNWLGKNLKLTTELQDLITKMLSIDPKCRPTAQECLEHPWFKLTTHPCASKIQIGPLEFSELLIYLRDIEVKKLLEGGSTDPSDFREFDFVG